MSLKVQWDTHSYTQGNHPLIQLSHFWESILKKQKKPKKTEMQSKISVMFVPVLFKQYYYKEST